MKKEGFSAITPQVEALCKIIEKNDRIDPELYIRHNVKRGLRDQNGKGVVAGLTEISEIIASREEDGVSQPCEGKLYYRGIDIEVFVNGFTNEGRFGFEEAAYLLIIGQLPTKEELADFTELLAYYRSLPSNFVRDVVMKAPSHDMMNMLARGVLTLFSYDDDANDISVTNVLRQSLQLTAILPLVAVYGYHSFRHYHKGGSLYIHPPKKELSMAENILHMLRSDSTYTQTEARILDLALVLHAEHGGGNNSTFTNHVVTSSGTDTYSAMAASICSLKGPKHGGANIKVVEMFDDLMKRIADWDDEDAVEAYLSDLLNKNAFDRMGLIYGMGHAVYSLSDPRCNVLKRYTQQLATEKGKEREYKLYTLVERLAPKVIARERRIYKGVSANVDFYSGFIYSMLDLPIELFTPVFSIARMAGWSAHRMEELTNAGKIIRPAYECVYDRHNYVPISER